MERAHSPESLPGSYDRESTRELAMKYVLELFEEATGKSFSEANPPERLAALLQIADKHDWSDNSSRHLAEAVSALIVVTKDDVGRAARGENVSLAYPSLSPH
jgi:hypothetical protein